MTGLIIFRLANSIPRTWPNTVTTLSGVAGNATETGPNALTSLSGVEISTATTQKALTSLAVATADILTRYRSFG